MAGTRNKIKAAIFTFFSLIAHLLGVGITYYFWLPIIRWYWNYRPVLGVDFYNAVSYVAYLARHFSWKFNGWRFSWWGGYPTANDPYPTLHFYLILPFLKFFSLVQAVQFYMLLSCFLFIFFSYLLFWEVGKNRILAVVLAIALAFSIAIYGSLVWGGSLPYFATQFFLPLVLWSLLKYFNSKNNCWFYLSSFFLGLSFLGHPQVGFSFIVPISFLMFLVWSFEKEKFFSLRKFKRIFIYFLVAALIGYPQLGAHFGRTPMEMLALLPGVFNAVSGNFLKLGKSPIVVTPSATNGGQVNPNQTAIDIARFNRTQLSRFWTDTNQMFFWFLVAGAIIFFFTLFLRKEKRKILSSLMVFLLPVLWVVFYITIFGFGISIFHGGWYRVFWPFPLILGVLISFFWGNFQSSIKERFGLSNKKFAKIFLSLGFSLVIAFFGFFLLNRNPAQKALEDIEIPLLRQQSSAFPDSLNVYVSKDELVDLRKKLFPSWLNPSDVQYRLYEADQRVNIWWTSLFDMPLVKGYIEPPAGDSSGGFYWTSIALCQFEGKDTLVESWGTPEKMAYSNALFLIDWYSIKFLEGEHEKSDSYNPPSSYLVKNDIFSQKEKVVIPGWAQLYTGEKGPISWYPEEEEYLTYYEIKDELVSPITHLTNTPIIGVIGAIDAYRTILRDLAALNLNSRKVVPLHLGQFIDGVPFQTLKEMDSVILYAYDYRNHTQSWAKIEKYVNEGGRVFIETGSDVKQTDSVKLAGKYSSELPAVFPMEMTKQEKIGKKWQLSGDSKETENINLEAFGPPVLDGEPWLFSLPNTNNLRENSQVILANGEVPLVVSRKYGQGEIIWSGMNLPYHITVYKNIQEAKFFQNLLGNFLSFEGGEYPQSTAERKSAEKVIIKGSKARGAFFREQFFSGWVAKLITAGKSHKLRIYPAGPTHPGFIYVVIPEKVRDSEFEIVFEFKGNFWGYFWQVLSLLVSLILLDKILFGSRLVIPIVNKIWGPIGKKVGSWWKKEDEY